jgi:hypothetical protein
MTERWPSVHPVIFVDTSAIYAWADAADRTGAAVRRLQAI